MTRLFPAIILAIQIFLPVCAQAHFGLLIPSQPMVMEKKDATLEFDIAFSHPFNGLGMEMRGPRAFFVDKGGEKSDLLQTLTQASYMGAAAFRASYKIGAPGVYQFAVIPEPYFEPLENRLIIHYAKTIVAAYGAEDGWEQALGLPLEIVPLSRPFGNYAGNIFTGRALKNGRPLPGALVEVEYLNNPPGHVAPNPYFETQTVIADENGVFSFGIPWAGWWGFAALAPGDEQIMHDGEKREVELGGVLWLNFHAAEKR